MGFVLKSVFWLGLVYSAMPLGELPSSEVGAIACDAATKQVSGSIWAADPTYRKMAVAGCLAALRGHLSKETQTEQANPAGGANTSARLSRQSLTEADLRPTWVGQNAAAATRHRRGS